MKRDMDIIRTILLRIEESENDGVTARDFPDSDPKLINYHLGLVRESGLANGKRYGSDGEALSYELFELTGEGHDFLDSIRRDNIWHKVKKKFVDDLVDAPLAVIKSAAMFFLRQ
ncbi:MAG: DUF2513 domain-containing protein [Phycisphaerae bacterium]|nr:DUF2513 domain-containing protein [Phycisphaerae bacterium]